MSGKSGPRHNANDDKTMKRVFGITIEERAEKYALEVYYQKDRIGPLTRDDLVEAYLAGSAQTQAGGD